MISTAREKTSPVHPIDADSVAGSKFKGVNPQDFSLFINMERFTSGDAGFCHSARINSGVGGHSAFACEKPLLKQRCSQYHSGCPVCNEDDTLPDLCPLNDISSVKRQFAAATPGDAAIPLTMSRFGALGLKTGRSCSFSPASSSRVMACRLSIMPSLTRSIATRQCGVIGSLGGSGLKHVQRIVLDVNSISCMSRN